MKILGSQVLAMRHEISVCIYVIYNYDAIKVEKHIQDF